MCSCSELRISDALLENRDRFLRTITEDITGSLLGLRFMATFGDVG
jgi:hypothetical protein